MVPDSRGTVKEEFSFARPLALVVVLPVYNDWEAANLVLRQIDSVCARSGLKPAVLLVNDGSDIPVPDDFLGWGPRAFSEVYLLELYKNLGHQRAICIGMVHIYRNSPDAAVLVMDADGEDPPEQIPWLVRTYLERDQRQAVFAARGRRMEGFAFKAFYQLYRLLHLALVGSDIRIGNFSLVPPTLVARLVRSGDLWNHYAASVVKSKLPLTTIPLDRAKRLKGRSKMNFVGLVLHGLSAISVYTDTIGLRILILTGLLLGLGMLALAAVVAIRCFTNWAIPGWATNVFALTVVLMFQVVIVSLLFTFEVLASRSGQSFIPLRDCPHLVLGVRRLGFERG